jgi:hypothetical protein
VVRQLGHKSPHEDDRSGTRGPAGLSVRRLRAHRADAGATPVERANVNLATNTATVEFDPAVRVRDAWARSRNWGTACRKDSARCSRAGIPAPPPNAAIFATRHWCSMSHGMLHVPYCHGFNWRHAR